MDEETLTKKRAKAQRDGNMQVLADVEKKLGDLYFDKKQYDDALEAYKGQLQACECLGDKLNCAIAHRMIGEVSAYIENFDYALEHQNLYLEIAKELGNLIEEQRAYATLGRTYFLVAESIVRDSSKKTVLLKDARRAYSKSIKLCDKLENKIELNELMMMRARLLLNLGLVLEQQTEIDQAVTLINQAAVWCKKHKLYEDLHRTYIALATLNERLGKYDQTFKNLDDAAKVDDVHLKNDAHVIKAETLLRLGEWMQAQQILHNLYKSKRLLEPTRINVTKLLRIAVTLTRSEDKLLVEDDVAKKEKIYETMGDAAVAAKSLDKAVSYYQSMLACAEVTKSSQLGAALTSLAQTLKDAGKFKEAIPYALRELELCKEAKDELNSLLILASLMIDANSPDEEIRTVFNRTLSAAKKTGDPGLEKTVLKDFIEYLEKMDDVDLEQIESLKEIMENLPQFNSEEFESEEDQESPDIGADICLDELSDVEPDVPVEKAKIIAKPMTRRHRCVIKKNEKGETQLHVACIKGNVSQVERLLEEQHPTLVRDHCGWTPLHEAANHGFVEIVRLLVRAGADVNDPGGAKCDGVTPLHDAAANGHAAVVQLLLDSGADPNLLTKTGDSALDCLEQWKKRVDNPPAADYVEYVRAKARLKELITVKTKKKKHHEATKWSALIDDDDEATVDDRPKTVEDWVAPERISAGEDYKRTIAAMQHPGRQLLGKRSKSPARINAPLIDSDEMLVDDWLEDDLGQSARHKERAYFDGVPPASNAPSKRKSKNDSDHEIEREVDKSLKRQKIAPSPIRADKVIKKETVVSINENSCDSAASSESIFEVFDQMERWPRKRKPKQTNLLKQGFTKSRLGSRSTSPTESLSPEPPLVYQIEHERHSWDSGFASETLDLEISVDGEDFELKLHSRDFRKTMSDIEELIKHKFEIKTGCKPKIAFKTVDGVALAAEVTLDEIPREKNKLRLFGDITQNVLPPIVDRYKKVCETYGIEPTDAMLRSLRSCDNTSTFRLSANESCTEELEPLARCLRYQGDLRSLNLSGATLYGAGELLAGVLERLANLSELHLQCCDIDSDCLSRLQRLPPQIRVLDLGYNPLGAGCQRKLADLLEPLKHLQTLGLRSCELDDFRYSFSCTSLVNLDISWNPIGGEGAAKLLQRQLLKLNLSNTQNFASNRVNVIDKIFFNDSLGISFFTLESLELSSCEATDLDVEKILSQTPNLTRINLSNNINVTKTSLCALLRRKPTMSYIDMSGCREIDSCPETNLKLATPQNCTLLINMKPNIIESWECLWQSKGYSKKLPHNLILFKPT